MWGVLRGSQLGPKFRRQQRIGPYFADFACQSVKLVVEIDGDTHAQAVGHDARRTAFLEREGYRVLRFSNLDVMTAIDGVATVILDAIGPSPSHAARGPLPLPQGERNK